MKYVLFPGRHHLVTRFQVEYLRGLVAEHPDALVVWAITSFNHEWTRRNPLPGHRREALVERVAGVEALPSVVVPVPDVPRHPRFSDLVLTTTETALRHLEAPTPANTIVACSTPEVAAEYAERGFEVAPVEAGLDPAPVRPWQVVERLAAGDASWEELAHPEVPAYFRRYGLVGVVRELFADPVVSAEGDLTGTRDYRTYAASFETASDRKYEQVGRYLEPGRVVDIGCATGGLLERIAADPRFGEADLFGVDVARPLLAEAEHKKEQGVFANPNIWFVRANILGTEVMRPASVDSTVSVALTHEVLSYGAGRADVETFARRVHDHTRPGGVWVNSDVVGPREPDLLVRLTLSGSDGASLAAPRTDLDDLPSAEVADWIGGLSTDARLVQFAYDFPRLSGASWSATRVGGEWELTLADAMEFLTTKDYADNWLSECHERFCALSYDDWVALLTDAGFELDPASGATTNPWLVEHRFDPVATLTRGGVVLPWPDTHVLTVARRPLG